MSELTSFVALGDSFTEGLDDPTWPTIGRRQWARPAKGAGDFRGWADRLAEYWAESHAPRLRYANLAIRGRRIDQVVEEQVPMALEMKPDLVSFAAGVNDAMRPNFDVDRVAGAQEEAVLALREAGSRVLLICYGRSVPTVVSGRSHGGEDRCVQRTRGSWPRMPTALMDFWEEYVFDDARFWSPDRLHLSAIGGTNAGGLGRGRGRSASRHRPGTTRCRSSPNCRGHVGGWRTWSGRAPTASGPWIWRRLRQVSSGAGVSPKRPELMPVRTDEGVEASVAAH